MTKRYNSSSRPPAPLLTRQQVAEHCQVSPRTVDRWIEDELLKVIKIGRSVRIHPYDLDAFIARFSK